MATPKVENGPMATYLGPPPPMQGQGQGQGGNGKITRPNVLVRELAPEEFEQLKTVPPFNIVGTPSPLNSKILVAQDETNGEIVGFFALSACVHIEPLWVAPTHRTPGILKKLWRGMRDLLLNTGNFFAFAIINDDDIPRGILSQAVRLGFKRVPGGLYMVNVLDPDLEKAAGPLPIRSDT